MILVNWDGYNLIVTQSTQEESSGAQKLFVFLVCLIAILNISYWRFRALHSGFVHFSICMPQFKTTVP